MSIFEVSVVQIERTICKKKCKHAKFIIRAYGVGWSHGLVSQALK